MNAKKVKIDFLYLDNETFTRCMQTEKQLESALDNIVGLLQKAGHKLILNKLEMDTKEKAIEHKFSKSPTIRVNDIGFEQKESQCTGCGDLCGCHEGTTCRTWVMDGKEYEVPPEKLITDRVLQVFYGNDHAADKGFELSENLENYYSEKNK